MIAAVDKYLAVRRSVGFSLSNAQYLLRSFAAYAAGFLLSTLLMHMVGLLAGHKLFQLRQGMARGMGLMLAAAGLWMSLAAV